MMDTRYTERLRHGLASLLHQAIIEQDMRLQDLAILTGVAEKRISDILSAKQGNKDLTLGEIGSLFEMLNHDLTMTSQPSLFQPMRAVSVEDATEYQIDMFAKGEDHDD